MSERLLDNIPEDNEGKLYSPLPNIWYTGTIHKDKNETISIPAIPQSGALSQNPESRKAIAFTLEIKKDVDIVPDENESGIVKLYEDLNYWIGNRVDILFSQSSGNTQPILDTLLITIHSEEGLVPISYNISLPIY